MTKRCVKAIHTGNVCSVKFCNVAKEIIKRQGNEMVVVKGEPTDLYWHLTLCERCSTND